MNTFAAPKTRRPSAGPVRASPALSGPAAAAAVAGMREAPVLPTLEELIQKQDFTGAVTLLQFQQQAGEGGPLAAHWLAYACFHLGDYKRALDTYRKLLQVRLMPPHISLQCNAHRAFCEIFCLHRNVFCCFILYSLNVHS